MSSGYTSERLSNVFAPSISGGLCMLLCVLINSSAVLYFLASVASLLSGVYLLESSLTEGLRIDSFRVFFLRLDRIVLVSSLIVLLFLYS